jgi:hypothetical protein
VRKALFALFALAALAAGQTHRWAYRYSGEHGVGISDAVNFLHETSGGSILLCGGGIDNGLSCALLVEVSTAGTETWVGVLDSVIPYAMCRAQGGRAIVAGQRLAEWDGDRAPWSNDATIVCVTPGGGEVWRYDFDHPDPHSVEEVWKVIQAPNGNVYAIGKVDNSLCLWALDGATGGLLDRVEMLGPGSVNLSPLGLCCSPAGEVYFSGRYLADNWNMLVQKYQAGGSGWATIYDGHGYDDEAPLLAVSPAGGVIMAGYTKIDNSISKLVVANLSPLTGNREWTYEYSFNNQTDIARGMAFDAVGNIYVTGGSAAQTTAQDFVVLSLSNAGQERWVDRYSGPTMSDDYGMAIDVGEDGNVYAIGNSQGTGYNWDFCAVSLTPEGSRRWVHRYDAGGNEWVNTACGLYASDGNVYIGGSGADGSGGGQMLLESVDPAAGIAEQGKTVVPRLPGATVARGRLRLVTDAVMFAADGRRARDLVAGENDISGVAPGAYIVRTGTESRPLRIVH